MSCHHGSVPQDVRPGTARVLVTELSGHINPTPAMNPSEDSETAVELYLSREKLVSSQKCLKTQLALLPLIQTVDLCLYINHVTSLCKYLARQLTILSEIYIIFTAVVEAFMLRYSKLCVIRG